MEAKKRISTYINSKETFGREGASQVTEKTKQITIHLSQ